MIKNLEENMLVRFADYSELSINDNELLIKFNKKTLRLKGEIAENYIFPILDYLTVANTVGFLFGKLKELSNSSTELSMNNFKLFLLQLCYKAVVIVVDDSYLNNSTKRLMSYFNRLNFEKKESPRVCSTKSLVIFSFLENEEIAILAKNLSDSVFGQVTLVYITTNNFCIDRFSQTEFIHLEKISCVSEKDKVDIDYMGYIEKSDFVLVLGTDYLANSIKLINELCYKLSKPTLNSIINDKKIRVGPLCVDKRIASYNSWLKNLNESIAVEYADKKQDSYIHIQPNNYLNKLSNMYIAMGLITNEIIGFYTGQFTNENPSTYERVLTINPITYEKSIYRIVNLD